MKITQEQIDAALRYESNLDAKSDTRLLNAIAKDRHGIPLPYDGAIIALAAAYREKCDLAENLQRLLENILREDVDYDDYKDARKYLQRINP